jgi:hypothetical protein
MFWAVCPEQKQDAIEIGPVPAISAQVLYHNMQAEAI